MYCYDCNLGYYRNYPCTCKKKWKAHPWPMQGTRPDIQVTEEVISELRKSFHSKWESLRSEQKEKESDGKMKWKIEDGSDNTVTQAYSGNVCIRFPKGKTFSKDTWKEFKQMVDELLDISEENYESTTK